MDDFKLEVLCNKCGSNNVRICKHIDYTGGLDETMDYSGDIVLICKNEKCNNRKLIKLDWEVFI